MQYNEFVTFNWNSIFLQATKNLDYLNLCRTKQQIINNYTLNKIFMSVGKIWNIIFQLYSESNHPIIFVKTFFLT